MRIRKRQVLFPLPSLSPVPLSDPHLNRSPMVQLQLHSSSTSNSYPHEDCISSQRTDTIAHLDCQPSDHRNQPIGGGANGFDSSDAGAAHEMEKAKDSTVLLQKEEKEEIGEEGERSNDTRKKSNLGADVGSEILPQSSPQQAFGRWYEGEKVFPLKKRRGSFERRASEDTIKEKDKKVNGKMKTKMNKKCVQHNDNEKEEKEAKGDIDSTTGGTKKRARGGALMEGSRCSRVNGRGWRCCQQTLVGYSLCEHHLGKGRLRSMTSVRSRSLTSNVPKKKDTEPLARSSSTQERPQKGASSADDDGKNGNEEDEKPLTSTKKRLKLGMVKARSISSLLGQTNNAVAVTDNEK